MTTSAALRARRVEAVARSLDISAERLETLVRLAYEVWCVRHPWLRSWRAFRMLGRRHTERFVAGMLSDAVTG